MHDYTENLTVENIDIAIEVLTKYDNVPSLKLLILRLEALKQDIGNESLLAELIDTWRNLGVYQGAVLTHLPHFYNLLPDDIFGDEV